MTIGKKEENGRGEAAAPMRRSPEDDEIISLLLEGRPVGAEKLLDRYGQRAIGLCRMMLNDGGEAEDALQCVIIKVWRSRKHLGSVRNLKSWVLKVATNECLDRIKSRRKGETTVDPEHSKDQWEDRTPLTEMEIRENRETVGAAIARLPERFKIVLLCKFQQHFTNEETAQMLGVTMGNLRVLLCRALAMLRKEVRGGK